MCVDYYMWHTLIMPTQLQLSACRDWDKHIAGVKKIIELRGGIKNAAGRDIHLDSMLAYFMMYGHFYFLHLF